MADDSGHRFGRYRVERKLGEGGMGTVFQAHDELLGRKVAIKTVSLKGGASQLFKERFLQEARAVAALSHHPNIVPVHDLGFEGEIPFLVMELVRGLSLKERIAKAPLGASDVRRLGVQLARALEAGPELWKLADFGVAHVPDSSLTMTGQFVGSPAYAAPESYLLGQFGEATDVYGLGATLYEAATGRRPYADDKLATSLAAVASRPEPVAISTLARDMPDELATAIMLALARDPASRPSAAELADLLAGGRAAPRAAVTSALTAPSSPAGAQAPSGLEPTMALPGASPRALNAAETSSVSHFATSSAATPPAPRTGRPWFWLGAAASAVVAVIVAVTLRPAAKGPELAEPVSPADPPAAAGPPTLAQAAPDQPDHPSPAAPATAIAPAAVDKPDAAASAVVAPSPDMPALQRYREMVAAGRGSGAVTPLVRLRKQHPRNAEMPYLLGQIYFDRLWCSQGVEAFRAAIALDPGYRSDERLNRSALHCFLSPPNSGRVTRFLRDDVGAAAVPYLREMATKHPNSKVRERVARALRSVEARP